MNYSDTISIVWSYEDVKCVDLKSKYEEDASLSDDDARYILNQIKHYHDATIGITYDVIQDYIYNFRWEKERKDK
jgi:hypothetical protein